MVSEAARPRWYIPGAETAANSINELTSFKVKGRRHPSHNCKAVACRLVVV